MNADKKTTQDLIAKAEEHKLNYKSILDGSTNECEFISCQESAILHIDGFDVCVEHGFRLIQCLTEKMKDDTVDQSIK